MNPSETVISIHDVSPEPTRPEPPTVIRTAEDVRNAILCFPHAEVPAGHDQAHEAMLHMQAMASEVEQGARRYGDYLTDIRIAVASPGRLPRPIDSIGTLETLRWRYLDARYAAETWVKFLGYEVGF